ncbi:hypothetical protein MMC14_003021 [Varicellaria rhodocarpa]|nr:hypothetical protein [Varicellaria rhodocarpa]
MTSKRILVIGGTGDQGSAVVHTLHAAPDDYVVRVLTRNPGHERAKAFENLGVEITQGHLALITLADLAAFAVTIFHSRSRWSGASLNTASSFSTGEEIPATTARVAGVKATFRAPSFEKWMDIYPDCYKPVASSDSEGG